MEASPHTRPARIEETLKLLSKLFINLTHFCPGCCICFRSFFQQIGCISSSMNKNSYRINKDISVPKDCTCIEPNIHAAPCTLPLTNWYTCPPNGFCTLFTEQCCKCLTTRLLWNTLDGPHAVSVLRPTSRQLFVYSERSWLLQHLFRLQHSLPHALALQTMLLTADPNKRVLTCSRMFSTI